MARVNGRLEPLKRGIRVHILLFGGTDLSLMIADHLQSMGFSPVGVVYVARSFPISYQPGGVTNVRYADLASWAEQRGIPAHHYKTPKEALSFASSVRADFGLLAGWFHLVPRVLRDHFTLGCAGVHASLLPKFRGGAPLNWALLAGETTTGVSLFELGDEVDDGPIYGQQRIPIGPNTRIGDLVDAAHRAALEIVSKCIPALAEGRLAPKPQAGTPSYCLQRTPDDGWIDWRRPTAQIDRLVRAVGRPYPGAATVLGGQKLTVWGADPVPDVQVYGVPGQITRLPADEDPCVVTGDGVLAIREATDMHGESVLGALRKASQSRLGAPTDAATHPPLSIGAPPES